jgi:hypothetical protein
MKRYYNVKIIDEETNKIIFSFRAIVNKKIQRSGRFSFKSNVDEDLYVSSFKLIDNNDCVVKSKNENKLKKIFDQLTLKKGTYRID